MFFWTEKRKKQKSTWVVIVTYSFISYNTTWFHWNCHRIIDIFPNGTLNYTHLFIDNYIQRIQRLEQGINISVTETSCRVSLHKSVSHATFVTALLEQLSLFATETVRFINEPRVLLIAVAFSPPTENVFSKFLPVLYRVSYRFE